MEKKDPLGKWVIAWKAILFLMLATLLINQVHNFMMVSLQYLINLNQYFPKPYFDIFMCKVLPQQEFSTQYISTRQLQ
jgi:hypothetical protein